MVIEETEKLCIEFFQKHVNKGVHISEYMKMIASVHDKGFKFGIGLMQKLFDLEKKQKR